MVHSHDGFCFQEDGAIRCALPEVEEHIHTEECYQIPEIVTDEGHTHADTCYQWLPGEAPTCSSGHIHQDSCYAVTLPTFCGEAENPEHIHEDACYVPEKILVCTMEEDPDHQHTQDCYSLTKGELLCTEAEREPILQAGEPELICGTEESEEHPHTEECYQIPEIVADEGHAHTDSCYQWLPSQTPDCGSGHIHEESCYTTVQPTFCGQAENPEHSHSDDCYAPQKTLVCAIAEEPDHQHTQDCYSLVKGELLCTEAEREPVLQAGDPVLTCEETEIILHSHTENCYLENEETQELILVCTQMVIEAHQHTQDCISITETKTLVCQLPEHTHQDTCRGNTLLTEEEQMDVDTLIFLIDALPSATQIEETLAAHKASGDDAALAAYSEKTLSQLRSTFDAYDALTENQKAAVTNAAALMGYEYLLDILAESMEPQPDFTVSLDNATVEVEVEGEPLPPGTQFTAQPVAADSESYSQAWQEAQTYLQEQSSILKDMELFDLGFADAEGQVLPVEAATKVTVTFAQPLVMSGQDLRVLHFGPEGLEEVTADILRDEQGISSVTIHAQGFSFYALTSSGEEHIAEKLDADMAYISLSMKEDPETDSQQAISTGTASWDSDDNPGNDSGPNNSILRTFDVATYTLIYETHLRQAAQDKGINGYRTGTVYFEFILPVTSEKAQFEVGSMGWLSTYHDVKYSIDPVENNGVPSQVLRGSFLAEPVQDNPAAIGNSISELNVAIRALAMQNEDTLEPQFTLWLDHNLEAKSSAVVEGIPTKLITGSNDPCPDHKEVEHKTITPASITISAAPRFNVALRKTDAKQTSYAGDFDFSTGNNLAMDKDGELIHGRMVGYGLTLQLAGKDPTSGLKGVEIPPDNSEFTFDIRISSEYTPTNKTPINLSDTNYRARIWSAAPNMYSTEQQDGRDIGIAVDYAMHAAPLNEPPDRPSAKFLSVCKDGGDWSFVQDRNDPLCVQVTVKNFTIDLSSLQYFPAATAGQNGEASECQYYNPNSESLQNAWDIQFACFSAGEFWTVQPLEAMVGSSRKTIQAHYGDGSLEFSIEDSNLRLNGNEIQQAVTSDDQQADGIGLTNPGNVQVQIHFVQPQKGWGSPLTPDCWENGYDWATPGQEVSIYQMLANDSAEGDSRGAAFEMMIKWDDRFFDPSGEVWTNAYTPQTGNLWWNGTAPECEILWVARGDGKGWNHHDLKPDQAGPGSDNNYDWNMIQAYGDQLYYYNSLEALKAAGKVPVGLLVQFRGIVGSGMNHMEVTVQGHVKEDCPTGYVYMATQYAAMWRIKDLAKLVRDKYYVENGGANAENSAHWLANRETMIDDYVRNHMPFRSTERKLLEYMKNYAIELDDKLKLNQTTDGMPDWIRGYDNNVKEYDSTPSDLGFDDIEKVWYRDGKMGGTSNKYLLDTCLVPPHVTNIRKTTAQISDQKQTSGTKETYSLDLNQRVVDYVLTPSVIRTLGSGPASGDTITYTTLTITDYLPKHLEYIPDTAYWGGTYVQDPECREPGTVTGGTKVDPAVVKNADGTSTLTWTLEDVPLTQLGVSELEPIHFSARLVGGLEDQQGIENTVTIQSTSDNQRQLTTANNNKAIYGITIQMSHSVSLVKLPDQDIVEMNDPIGFTMYVGNNSAEPLYNQIIVEDLPYHGDESGTSVHGPVNMTKFRVDPEFTDDLSFFCTTNKEFRGKKPEFYLDTSRAGKGNRNSAGEIIPDKASQLDYFIENGWQKLTFDPDGTANNLPADTVQIVAVGTLPAGETLHMFTTVTLPESQPGDVVWNDLMLETLHSKAHTRVVGRSIEGLTWIDANHDGIQDSNETLQSGITVTLLKLDENNQYEEVSSIQSGQQINVLRSSSAEGYDQGRYKFTGLLPGTYAVRFTSGEFDITYYHPSPDNAGDDDTRDSDGIPTLGNNQTLIATQISDIKMPTIEELHGQDTYHSPHHDSGFYAWSVELPATGGSGTSLYLFSGWAMIAIACALMYHTRRKQRKGAA